MNLVVSETEKKAMSRAAFSSILKVHEKWSRKVGIRLPSNTLHMPSSSFSYTSKQFERPFESFICRLKQSNYDFEAFKCGFEQFQLKRYTHTGIYM